MLKRLSLALAVAALLIASVPGVAGAASPDPQGLWPTSQTPPCIADGSGPCNVADFNGTELGVKFQTVQPIYIVGVRFFRADAATWSGSLWDADSTWIASADDSTSGTGWQTAMFAAPVAMGTGDTFVASYFAPTGAYAFEWDYFTSGRTVGPVTALGGAGVNGLYRYNSSSVFPTDTFRDTNYWVTPLWVPKYTLSGFYAPVDMGGTLNSVKGGSTVPLKFEVFDSATGAEQSDVAVIGSFGVQPIACDSQAEIDAIEVTTLGGTSLRYDPTAGQFIQNWKTPKTAGCYRTTMTMTDGSSLVAYFKVR